MKYYRLPMLSTYNGPSYLLHAVETLLALGARQRNLRFLPVIAWHTTPEVLPYYRNFSGGDAQRIDPDRLHARILINIRESSRLRAFLPLIAVGLAPRTEAFQWLEEGRNLQEAYDEVYSRLSAVDPDWSNDITPAERIAGQICSLFPELRTPGVPMARPSDRMLVRSEGKWYERANPYLGLPYEHALQAPKAEEAVTELVEVFFTEAFLFIAAADAMGGMEFEMKVGPQAREISSALTRQSGIREVVQWFHTYPHLPLPQVSYPPQDLKEEWDLYFAACPGHDNIFETAPGHWTEEDPAFLKLFEEFVGGQGEDDTVSAEEMLSLAWKHLPDYIPHYPRLSAVTGGMNIEGALVTLMETWLLEGSFLGMQLPDWQLFSTTDQFILCGLLMQRSQTVDQGNLFVASLHVLIEAEVTAELETFQLEAVRLGEPLAQPGRSLALSGVVALHSPTMVLHIDMDRTDEEESDVVEKKIHILARLFLPVHIPLQLVWKVNWPILGQSAFLQQSHATETAPASRLGW